jgi:curved DNA-binding protein CbpA
MQRVEALALLGFDNSHDGPLAFVGPSKLDIKRAFRERAVKLHPDVSHEDDIQSNTERFRELVDAYELLIATSR